MSWIEAFILGLVQGLTEFLPVSSSGHLELGKYLLNINPEKSLIFTVVVHGATVLSTMVVFWKDIWQIVKGLLKFELNDETLFVLRLIFSMVPVLIVGLFFIDEVEQFFNGNIVFVGSMLLVTSAMLASTVFIKKNKRKIGFIDSFIIGIAQTLAVLPGISRSGATISTGLIIGNKRELITRFSFLMVLIPIIGANLKSLMDTDLSDSSGIGVLPLIVGFLAAFISGLFACKWMIRIVNKGKLIYFAIYTFVIGSVAIIVGLL